MSERGGASGDEERSDELKIVFLKRDG